MNSQFQPAEPMAVDMIVSAPVEKLVRSVQIAESGARSGKLLKQPPPRVFANPFLKRKQSKS
jgi:hypothetical protein